MAQVKQPKRYRFLTAVAAEFLAPPMQVPAVLMSDTESASSLKAISQAGSLFSSVVESGIVGSGASGDSEMGG